MTIATNQASAQIIGGVCFAAAVALVWWGFFLLRRRQLIADTPTSKCAGVFMGWNEVAGQAVTDTPTTSHFAALSCVQWVATVEQEIRTTSEHTTTDSNGHTTTTTTTNYEWRVVERWADGGGIFRIVDDSGSVFVDPTSASVRMRRVVDRVLGRRQFFRDGPTGRTRERESVIEVGEPLYVVGTAQLRDDAPGPVIDTDGDGPFIVATGGESGIRRRYAVGGPFVVVGALAVGAIGGAMLIGRGEQHTRVAASLLGVAIVGVLVMIAAVVLFFNGMVRVRNRADRAYSLIDVMLQRRHDLVPRLVACVNGAVAHERRLQVSLAEYRSTRSMDAGAGETAGDAQSAVLGQVFALVEAYPDLQTNVNFTHLQATLSDTEDRIAAAREFYNASATALRDRTHTFPGVVLVRFGEFADRPLFAADGFERTVAPIRIAVPTLPATTAADASSDD